MASTPSVGGTIHTPTTPLHGAAYDSYEPYSPRYQTRATSRKLHQAQTPEPVKRNEARRGPTRLSTPPTNRHTSYSLNSALSPPPTARRSPKRKVNSRTFPASPNSPGDDNMDDFAPAAPRLAQESHGPSSLFSSSTTMHEGMLPTPVKTPRKKQVANIQAASRALFQDPPLDLQETAAAPRRFKKARRYNGFSLESFTAEDDGTSEGIQIFTDSKDKVPELDETEDNPFLDHGANGEASTSKKVTGTSKRRKISGPKSKDKDVEETIKKDQGMIYVFRGRKVYRKFESDDEEDEEEVLDPEDLGLLEHLEGSIDASRLSRPLTRKSIKPTRLFQTPEQKRTREAEKEEEALTDIEDAHTTNPDVVGEVEVIDLITPKANAAATQGETSKARTRTHTAKDHLESDGDAGHLVPASKARVKKSSPFDSWKRVKRGTVSESSTTSKGKRPASEAASVDEVVKKLKA